MTTLEHARKVADAVMVEGYALYPFRASAPKNWFRWTFGVLAPRVWSEAGGCEPWWLESQVLITGGSARISGELRFYQVVRRRVEKRSGAGYVPASELDAGGRLVVGWDEGALTTVPIVVDLAAPRDLAFAIAGGVETEELGEHGRLIRERVPLQGKIAVRVERVSADQPLWRVALRVENTTAWADPASPRDQAVAAGFASTHLLLEGAEFVSLFDPPGWAMTAAAATRNTRTYPVLAGPPGSNDVVLSAPFILYDHPQVAPESVGDFCDACEIDELLALRTMTLTDREKREARATDPMTAQILERVEGMPDEWLARVHGAARDVHNAEMVPRAVAKPAVGPGMRVRLRPGPHTDAQDLLYAGMTATVIDIKHDVDGRDYLAVTVDNDPAAELHHWYGRYHYYRLDEVELLAEDALPRPA